MSERATKPTIGTCNGCLFWEFLRPGLGGCMGTAEGACLRFPPIRLAPFETDETVSADDFHPPVTYAFMWCGEFSSITEREASSEKE
jgi:hypothetical protein